MSYLSRHRPICTVIQEIAEIASAHGEERIVELCAEATDYAQRMSARLREVRHLQDTNKALIEKLNRLIMPKYEE